MDTRIIRAYCLCDDMLKVLCHRDHAQCQLHDAEVMTVAFVAALYYGGNFVVSIDACTVSSHTF